MCWKIDEKWKMDSVYWIYRTYPFNISGLLPFGKIDSCKIDNNFYFEDELMTT